MFDTANQSRLSTDKADFYKNLLETERHGREQADKEIISLLHDVKNRYESKLQNYMAKKQNQPKAKPNKGKGKGKDDDDDKVSPTKQAEKPNDDWGSSTQPAGNQDDGWGSTTQPAQAADDGWGDTTQQMDKAGDDWGSSAQPADKSNDGWGTSAQPDDKATDDWGSSTQPADKANDDWGTSTQAADKVTDDWGSSTQPADKAADDWSSSTKPKEKAADDWSAPAKSTPKKSENTGTPNKSAKKANNNSKSPAQPAKGNKKAADNVQTTTKPAGNAKQQQPEPTAKPAEKVDEDLASATLATNYLQSQLDLSREEITRLKKRNLRLEKDLEHSKSLIRTLREGCSLVEEQARSFETRHDRVMTTKADLERELIAIKEESSRHITTIDKLQKSNEQLSKAFVTSVQSQEACKQELDVLQQRYHRKLESYQIANLRLTEANSQLRKLCEYMQK